MIPNIPSAASRFGHLPVVVWLVESEGCTATDKAQNGVTPVHLAAAKGSINCLRWLTQSNLSYANNTFMTLCSCGISIAHSYIRIILQVCEQTCGQWDDSRVLCCSGRQTGVPEVSHCSGWLALLVSFRKNGWLSAGISSLVIVENIYAIPTISVKVCNVKINKPVMLLQP